MSWNASVSCIDTPANRSKAPPLQPNYVSPTGTSHNSHSNHHSQCSHSHFNHQSLNTISHDIWIYRQLFLQLIWSAKQGLAATYPTSKLSTGYPEQLHSPDSTANWSTEDRLCIEEAQFITTRALFRANTHPRTRSRLLKLNLVLFNKHVSARWLVK